MPDFEITNAKQDPCILCRGSGRARHPKPSGVTNAEWLKKVGENNHCPLCRGSGQQQYMTLGALHGPGEKHAISVHSVSTTDGRVLAACNFEGTCTEWIDCTPYMDRGKLQETNTIGTCPSGHALKMGTRLNGKNR